MQHWSKRIGIALLACLMLLLCACGSKGAIYAKTQYYTICNENGQWLMEFTPQMQAVDKVCKNSGISRTVPIFRSLSDMRRRLKHGNTDPYNLSTLYADHALNIYDLDNLQELVTPKGMTYDHIAFGGHGYNFWFRSSKINGYISCENQSWYEWALKEYYTNFTDYQQVLSDTTAADRNARVIESILEAYVRKDILYTIQTGNQTLYIREEYLTKCITDSPYTAPLSETVPYKVYIFGNDGINYFYGQLEGFDERPSVEWLSAFRLKPHSEGKPALIGLSVGVVVAGLILAVAGCSRKARPSQDCANQKPDKETDQ